MLAAAPIRLLSLASMLALHSATVLAASPWQCDSNPDGLWDCASRAATVEPEAPPTVADVPPVILTDEPIATEPAATDSAPQTPAATTVPVPDTPLFPTAVPEATTQPAIAPDTPAIAEPQVSEPVSDTSREARHD